MTKRLFTWGDMVVVKHDAPAKLRPQETACVVGLLRKDAEGFVYTIEYEDGSDAEILECFLEIMED